MNKHELQETLNQHSATKMSIDSEHITVEAEHFSINAEIITYTELLTLRIEVLTPTAPNDVIAAIVTYAETIAAEAGLAFEFMIPEFHYFHPNYVKIDSSHVTHTNKVEPQLFECCRLLHNRQLQHEQQDPLFSWRIYLINRFRITLFWVKGGIENRLDIEFFNNQFQLSTVSDFFSSAEACVSAIEEKQAELYRKTRLETVFQPTFYYATERLNALGFDEEEEVPLICKHLCLSRSEEEIERYFKEHFSFMHYQSKSFFLSGMVKLMDQWLVYHESEFTWFHEKDNKQAFLHYEQLLVRLALGNDTYEEYQKEKKAGSR